MKEDAVYIANDIVVGTVAKAESDSSVNIFTKAEDPSFTIPNLAAK